MAKDRIAGLQTASALLNRLAKWVLLLAMIWLCWNIARIIWLLLAPPQAPNLPIAKLQPRPVSTLNTGATLAIFDQERPTPLAVQKPPPQVTLTGVLLAVPSSASSAMLEVNGAIANYRMQAQLGSTGYKVTAITWDKVTITDDSGHEVVLTMPERMSLDQGLNFHSKRAGSNSNNNSRPSNLSQPSKRSNNRDQDTDDFGIEQDIASVTKRDDGNRSNNSNDNNNNSNADDSQAVNSPAAQIDKAVSELKQNPASYLSRMGVMATGEGYQVTDAMPSKLKNRLGLESGDRVMSVNGRSIGSNPGTDADLLNQVKQSGEAQIEVKRGEQTITIRQQF